MFDGEVQNAIFKYGRLPFRPPYSQNALVNEPRKVLMFRQDQLWIRRLKYLVKAERFNTDSSLTAIRRASEVLCETSGRSTGGKSYKAHLQALCKAAMLWAGPTNLWEQEINYPLIYARCTSFLLTDRYTGERRLLDPADRSCCSRL